MANLNDYLSEDSLPAPEDAGKDPWIKDVLVDADALIALAKEDDSNHQKAVQTSQKLASSGVNYYISPFTIPEAATVISYKVSHPAAVKFLKEVRSLNLLPLSLPEKYQDLPDKWFIKQSAKGTSYFDCYNAALLDRYTRQIKSIFSFDSFYPKNGFQLAQT